MYKHKDTLVIIPARGGSKRIPKKNIKGICGQPMIYWPLMELSKMFYADDILISTDDQAIISSVEEKGLNVPFVRPENLSDDFTGTVPVAEHALNWYEENVAKVKYVIIVYPTAVMLRSEDLSAAIKSLHDDPECDSVMSSALFPFPIQRAVFQEPAGYLKMFQPEHYPTRSQDLQEAMHDAGQFYVCRAHALREGRTLVHSNVKPHLLHRNNVIDIDTVEDFEIADAKLKSFKPDAYAPGWKFERRS